LGGIPSAEMVLPATRRTPKKRHPKIVGHGLVKFPSFFIEGKGWVMVKGRGYVVLTPPDIRGMGETSFEEDEEAIMAAIEFLLN